MQNEFNLLAAKTAQPVLNFCGQAKIKFFAFSPLASGLLAARYPSVSEFPPDSRWAGWKATRVLPTYWTDKTFANLDQLKVMAETYNVTQAAVALRWCLEQSDVDVTLLGPRTRAHLSAAKEALSLSLALEDVKFLSECFAET